MESPPDQEDSLFFSVNGKFLLVKGEVMNLSSTGTLESL